MRWYKIRSISTPVRAGRVCAGPAALSAYRPALVRLAEPALSPFEGLPVL
ncbi:MAG: hypothetical protein MUD01_02935 [Chloroflexaceae bacterium]|nr:hypothetical protein [Chloroflexaceae bacterium]